MKYSVYNIINSKPFINTEIDHEINAVSSFSLRRNSLHSPGDVYQFEINIKIVPWIHVSSRVPDSTNARYPRYKAVQPHEIES